MRSSDRIDLTDWWLDGQAVAVPGTVVQVEPQAHDADLRTWEWTTVLDVPAGPWELVLEGVATSFEVELDGELVAGGTSMHLETRVLVEPAPGAVLTIRCLPLAGAAARGAPRARWRTSLADNSLRLVRTTLLGRMPGAAAGPPVIGPWRPVFLSRPRPPVRLRTELVDGTGVLHVESGAGTVRCGDVMAEVVDGRARLELPDVEPWWPHTHGEPVLHDVHLDDELVGRVGFRELTNLAPGSVDLVLNGVQVFVRGALWTPPGLLTGVPDDPRRSLELARDAGFNVVRFPGTGVYAGDDVLDLCDELGLLAWHELALATLDVPHEHLADLLDAEVDALLQRTAGRPSTAVLCGGSETAQQVAMLGLSPDLWESAWLRSAGDRWPGVWVANSPVGGELPMDPREGVSHWFGVGGYQQPLSTARTAEVRFASECLALSHVTDDPGAAEHGVPRDVGTGWDFEDVRQTYLAQLHGVDPVALRDDDPEQWLRRSRDVTGELTARVFGEWRRERSPTRGGLVLQLQDDRPGNGWGLLDSAGRPKAAWWHVRRALAPRTVWLVDEGLGGIGVHVSDDRRTGATTPLRVALYRHDGVRLDEAVVEVTGAWEGTVEGLLGRFVDASWAYRFGPPAHQLVAATLEDGTDLPPQAFLWPARRPLVATTGEELGLTVVRHGDLVRLQAARPVDGVRVEGARDDDAFTLEPGRARAVRVSGSGTVTALNLLGRVDPRQPGQEQSTTS